nr:MAG TPA_asm: hypothetical protein [Caudoviricetes sp.]DAM55249.1 MAG TPA: hypothetical protein [Caudoviricetes sp.]DAV20677.1 MAG TPA: hypothetical protein [Bacteriophage sp.]DAV77543.1 MAG TPA: hypothetical protein [Caudoviricetes sp.]DAZ71703.1 MAG TPA: hypothetical protein [Caudoviricetes sp.]
MVRSTQKGTQQKEGFFSAYLFKCVLRVAM